MRDVGEGEVDSSAWMCASTSGMEITKFAIKGKKRAWSRHGTYVYALMFSGLISPCLVPASWLGLSSS